MNFKKIIKIVIKRYEIIYKEEGKIKKKRKDNLIDIFWILDIFLILCNLILQSDLLNNQIMHKYLKYINSLRKLEIENAFNIKSQNINTR